MFSIGVAEIMVAWLKTGDIPISQSINQSFHQSNKSKSIHLQPSELGSDGERDYTEHALNKNGRDDSVLAEEQVHTNKAINQSFDQSNRSKSVHLWL